jgi:mannan endo-1,4-beta-mannosidase
MNDSENNDKMVYSWGEYDPSNSESLVHAQEYAREFVTSRSIWAFQLKKPIVLEEFGIARDAWRKPSDSAYKYKSSTPTSHRDTFYEGLYRHIDHLQTELRHAGSNFWAYGGLGRPTDASNEYNMIWLGG